jgi:hypothetical protein
MSLTKTAINKIIKSHLVGQGHTLGKNFLKILHKNPLPQKIPKELKSIKHILGWGKLITKSKVGSIRKIKSHFKASGYDMKLHGAGIWGDLWGGMKNVGKAALDVATPVAKAILLKKVTGGKLKKGGSFFDWMSPGIRNTKIPTGIAPRLATAGKMKKGKKKGGNFFNPQHVIPPFWGSWDDGMHGGKIKKGKKKGGGFDWSDALKAAITLAPLLV